MSEPRHQQSSHREMPPALRQALAVQREFIEEEFRQLRRQLYQSESQAMNGQATQKLWMIVGGVSVIAVIGMFALNLWTGESAELRRTVHLLEVRQGQLLERVGRLERDVEALRATIDKTRAILDQVYIDRFHTPSRHQAPQ